MNWDPALLCWDPLELFGQSCALLGSGESKQGNCLAYRPPKGLNPGLEHYLRGSGGVTEPATRLLTSPFPLLTWALYHPARRTRGPASVELGLAICPSSAHET